MADRDRIYEVVEQVLSDVIDWFDRIYVDLCGLLALQDMGFKDALDYAKIPDSEFENWSEDDWRVAEEYWSELVDMAIDYENLEEECYELAR